MPCESVSNVYFGDALLCQFINSIANTSLFHDNNSSQKTQCHDRVIEIIRDGLRSTMAYIDVMINHQEINLKLLQALSFSPSRPAYADQLVQ